MIFYSHCNLSQAGGSTPVRLPSAEDIAEYILLTGDQASVVNLIEGLVNNGKVSSVIEFWNNITLLCLQMSEEQALVYVETIKAMLESVEKEEEEEEAREMLLQRKLEEAEREYALKNLLRRGDFSFVKERGGRSEYFLFLAPQDKEENLYRQLRGRLLCVFPSSLIIKQYYQLHSRCLVNMNRTEMRSINVSIIGNYIYVKLSSMWDQ